MPCTYTGSIEGDNIFFANQANEKLGEMITHLTQMLCQMCEGFEDESLTPPYPVDEWWADHKSKDEGRRTAERKRIAMDIKLMVSQGDLHKVDPADIVRLAELSL